MSKNIFEIWAEIGKKVPFAVRRANWSEEYYTVVEKIEIRKWPYGNAFGYPTINGNYSDHYEYSQEWKSARIVPGAGSYQWSLVPNAILPNSEDSNPYTDVKMEYYKEDSVLMFGKYKGKKLKNIYQENADYIFWCIRNISTFFVSQVVLNELQSMQNARTIPNDVMGLAKLKGQAFVNTNK